MLAEAVRGGRAPEASVVAGFETAVLECAAHVGSRSAKARVCMPHRDSSAGSDCTTGEISPACMLLLAPTSRCPFEQEAQWGASLCCEVF